MLLLPSLHPDTNRGGPAVPPHKLGGPGCAGSCSALPPPPPPQPPAAPLPLLSPLCPDRKQPHGSASPHKRLFGNKRPPPSPQPPSPGLTLAAVLLAVACAHPAGFMPAAAAAAARRAPWPPRAGAGTWAGERRPPAPPSSWPAPVVIHGAPPPSAGAPPSPPPPPSPRSPAASPREAAASHLLLPGRDAGREAAGQPRRRLLLAAGASQRRRDGGRREAGRREGSEARPRHGETGRLGRGEARPVVPCSPKLVNYRGEAPLQLPVLFRLQGRAAVGSQLPLTTAFKGVDPVIKGAQQHPDTTREPAWQAHTGEGGVGRPPPAEGACNAVCPQPHMCERACLCKCHRLTEVGKGL